MFTYCRALLISGCTRLPMRITLHNTNTSAEMKICQNEKQDTSSEKNSSQTVEIRNKTTERRQCQKQNIFNNKLERSDQIANTNTSSEMKISHNWK